MRLPYVLGTILLEVLYACASDSDLEAGQEGSLRGTPTATSGTSRRHLQNVDQDGYLILTDGYEWSGLQDCVKGKDPHSHKPKWLQSNDGKAALKDCQNTDGCVAPKRWMKEINGKTVPGFFMVEKGTDDVCANFPVKKAKPLKRGFDYTALPDLFKGEIPQECKVLQEANSVFISTLDPEQAWQQCETSSDCDYVHMTTDSKGERGFNLYKKGATGAFGTKEICHRIIKKIPSLKHTHVVKVAVYTNGISHAETERRLYEMELYYNNTKDIQFVPKFEFTSFHGTSKMGTGDAHTAMNDFNKVTPPGEFDMQLYFQPAMTGNTAGMIVGSLAKRTDCTSKPTLVSDFHNTKADHHEVLHAFGYSHDCGYGLFTDPHSVSRGDYSEGYDSCIKGQVNAAMAGDTCLTKATTGSSGTNHYFILIANGLVAGKFPTLALAKTELAKFPAHSTTPSRMLAEVKDDKVSKDPHTISGQKQLPSEGFHKFWHDWHDINAMIAETEKFMQVAKLNHYFLLVGSDKVRGYYSDVKIAKEELKGWAASQGGSRMLVEVKGGKALPDPHTIAGENQLPSNGFEKFWHDWHDINRMIAAAKKVTGEAFA